VEAPDPEDLQRVVDAAVAALEEILGAGLIDAAQLHQDAKPARSKLARRRKQVGHLVSLDTAQADHGRRREQVEHHLLRQAALHPRGACDHLRAHEG
jgi:hypothetical protein